MSHPASSSGGAPMTAKEASVVLQDRLHHLLSRLSDAVEHIKNWPEAKAGDESKVHLDSTTKLITYLRNIISSVQRVESVVQSNPGLKEKLQECPIPRDLLDLLDHGQGGGALNPDCFVRGLLKQANDQLAGLKRRKLVLQLLGLSLKTSLNSKVEAAKRAREAAAVGSAEEASPPAKRQRTEGSTD